MTSTMSERETSSSRNESGIRPVMDRPPPGILGRALKLSAQFGFDFRADGAHVGAALGLGLDEPHDLAHVFDARGARGADAFIDQRAEFSAAQLRGDVALRRGDYRAFLIRTVLPLAAVTL